jgi:hypothetical protein
MLGCRRRGFTTSKAPANAAIAYEGQRPTLFGTVADPGTFDFYIGPSGSDSNDGLTTSTPWAITSLNTKRAQYAGRTIGFLDGTYDISSLNAPLRPFAVPLFNIAGGSSGSPTVLKSVNARGAHITAKTPGGTYTGSKSGNVYNGFSQPHEGGVFANTTGVTLGNITFDGLRMSGERTVLIRIGEGPGSSFNIAGVTIKNCELFDCNDAQGNNGTADGANICPLQTFNTDGLLIENCYFHDIISWTTNTADHLSAFITWYCRNTTVRDCTFVQAGALYGKEFPCPGLTIERCYIEDTRTSSAIFDFVGGVNPISATGLPTTIRNNVVYMPSGGGGIVMHATLGSGSSRTPMKDPLHIYSNTVACVSPGNISHIGYAINTNIAGQSRDYNNICFGGINIFERKMHSISARAPGILSYNWYPATGARFRLTSESTYGPDSGTAYSDMTSLRSAIQAAGGLSSADAELGSVQSAQTITQMFTQSGVHAARFQLAASSSALNAGRVGGTSSGAQCNIGAWDGSVASIGCDFA